MGVLKQLSYRATKIFLFVGVNCKGRIKNTMREEEGGENPQQPALWTGVNTVAQSVLILDSPGPLNAVLTSKCFYHYTTEYPKR